MIDLTSVRADTPGAAYRIHLNNAGAALMPQPVIDAITGHLHREAEAGGYEAADEARSRVERVYTSVARLIGASSDEIALTASATAAWQMAFYALSFQPGDRILTSRAEYAANYVAFLHVARRHGAVVEVIPDGVDGALDAAALERLIDDRARLIAVTWIPTNGGLVNPVAEVGRIARRHQIPFLLDACQAVGQMRVDVDELGCDMMSTTGRKFLRGPRGTGFLYVRREIIERLHPPMIDHFAAPWTAPDRYELRPDARRFETWEKNYAALLGLGAAADYALGLGMDAIEARCQALGAHLRDRLSSIEGVGVHDLGTERAAIVSFTVRGRDAREVAAVLAKARVNVSVSDPSSTLLDATARSLPALVRASLHYYNTEEELEVLVELCRGLAGG